jgi:hypothetical protein
LQRWFLFFIFKCCSLFLLFERRPWFRFWVEWFFILFAWWSSPYLPVFRILSFHHLHNFGGVLVNFWLKSQFLEGLFSLYCFFWLYFAEIIVQLFEYFLFALSFVAANLSMNYYFLRYSFIKMLLLYGFLINGELINLNICFLFFIESPLQHFYISGSEWVLFLKRIKCRWVNNKLRISKSLIIFFSLLSGRLDEVLTKSIFEFFRFGAFVLINGVFEWLLVALIFCFEQNLLLDFFVYRWCENVNQLQTESIFDTKLLCRMSYISCTIYQYWYYLLAIFPIITLHVELIFISNVKLILKCIK